MKKNEDQSNARSGAKRSVFSVGIKYLAFAVFSTVAFSLFYFIAKAGMETYPTVYSIQAVMENKIEVKAGSEINIVFNQPVVLLKSDNIKIVPDLEFDIELSDDGKNLALLHKEPFEYETKYEITLKNIRGLSGLLLEETKFVFFTEMDISDAGRLETAGKIGTFSDLELSRDRYIPPKISQPGIDLEIEPKFTEGKYIDVSIDHQIMTLFEDGLKVNSFLVSSGMLGYATPQGTYTINRKEDNHWSGYGLWMPYSLNFSGPYYIHELPYWPNGYREGENHLGTKASHGCIRLGIGPAEYVYKWAPIGTPLYIHK